MSTVKVQDTAHAIEATRFEKWGQKTLVGMFTLKNGVEIVESLSLFDAAKFQEDVAREIVIERLHHRVFELLGGQATTAAVVAQDSVDEKAFDDEDE